MKILNTLRKLIIVIMIWISGIAFADVEDIPYFILMINNQINELTNMALQMDRELKRFLSLGTEASRDFSSIDEDIKTIMQMKNAILNETTTLLSNINSSINEPTDANIRDIEESLQKLRYLNLKSNSQKEQAIYEEDKLRYQKNSNSDSILVQNQLMNEALHTLTAQLAKLVVLTQENNNMYSTESSLKYAKDKEQKRNEEQKVDQFFRSKSKFKPKSKMNNSIFE